MKVPRLPEVLVTPFHGFAILCGGALVASLLWPDPQIGRPLFLQALVFFQGILSLQVGDVEWGYGPVTAPKRLWRLFFFSLLALALVGPFLLVHRAETGASWFWFALSLLFLAAHGFVWSLVGHGLARVIRSDGLRFMAKYGGLVLAEFLPVVFGLPVSGFTTLVALWEGQKGGWPGLILCLGLGSGGALWWWSKHARS